LLDLTQSTMAIIPYMPLGDRGKVPRKKPEGRMANDSPGGRHPDAAGRIKLKRDGSLTQDRWRSFASGRRKSVMLRAWRVEMQGRHPADRHRSTAV
jgi:hypothetical protein